MSNDLPTNFNGSTSAYQLGINGDANFMPYVEQGYTAAPSFWGNLGNNIISGISSLSSLFGNNGNNNGGAFNTGLNLVQGIGSLYGAWSQNKLAKQALNQAKNQFYYNMAQDAKNFNAAAKTYNNDLAQKYETAAVQNTGNRHAYDDTIADRRVTG